MPLKRTSASVPQRCERGEHDLGVRARAELVAERLELDAQLAVVEDLAVVREHVATVRRGHRLLAGRRRVLDRQPPVAEAERPGDVVALGVGAAVGDGVGHALEDGVRDRRAVELEDAGEAAHRPLPRLRAMIVMPASWTSSRSIVEARLGAPRAHLLGDWRCALRGAIPVEVDVRDLVERQLAA